MKLSWLDKAWVEITFMTALLWSHVLGEGGDSSYYTGDYYNNDGAANDYGAGYYQVYNNDPDAQDNSYNANNHYQSQAEVERPYILCYTCHYQVREDIPEGTPGCDEPFDDANVETVKCYDDAPCGKIRQVMTGGHPDDYLVTRNCIPKCKERPNDEHGNYQECCSTSLCNGASGSRTTASSVTGVLASLASLFLLLR